MSKVMQLVGFKNGDEFFGVPIWKVKEIVRVPDITPVPDTPAFLKGLINLRGRIIAVVDMSAKLGAKPSEKKKSNRVLILEIDGSLVGLLVDSASEIIKIPEDSVDSPPEMVCAIGAEYVTGVGKLREKLIVILDINRLLSAADLLTVRSANPGADASRAEKCA